MTYTKGQLSALVLLRVAIGWHLLFEGASKLLNPSWSSKAYLLDSKGILSGFFLWMAEHDTILAIADLLNEWGLTLIGLALILGLFARIASIAGALLILLYYLSHPAWFEYAYMFPTEGTYFVVNKNLVEVIALLVLVYFPTSQIVGVERFFTKKK
jgi:thiosulfate dehydrogenase [quinone] large subunit